MLKHLEPLPISEEMLGAYLEGNLTVEDICCVESALQTDELLRDLVAEVNNDGIIWKDYIDNSSIPQGLDFIDDLQIPDIPLLPTMGDESILINTPFNSDVAVCAAFMGLGGDDSETSETLQTNVEQGEVRGLGDYMDDSALLMNDDI